VRARTELETAVENSKGNNADAVAHLGYLFAFEGDAAKAKQLQDQLAPHGDQHAEHFYQRAIIAAGLGHKSEAIDLLNQAYRTHASDLPYVAVDPMLYALHDEPAFKDLLRRLGLSS